MSQQTLPDRAAVATRVSLYSGKKLKLAWLDSELKQFWKVNGRNSSERDIYVKRLIVNDSKKIYFLILTHRRAASSTAVGTYRRYLTKGKSGVLLSRRIGRINALFTQVQQLWTAVDSFDTPAMQPNPADGEPATLKIYPPLSH